MTGPLTVDGVLIEPRWLRTTTDRLASALSRAKAGIGRSVIVAAGDPVNTVVAMLAAEKLACPLLLSPETAPLTVPAWAMVAGVEAHAPMSRPSGVLPEETAAVLWTSGSAGRPKAVALSWSALAYQATATAQHLSIGNEDRLLLPIPLHHSYALSVLRIWRATGAHLFVESAFRPRRITELILNERITAMDGIPTMYRILLQDAAANPQARQALAIPRIRGCGGDTLSAKLHEEFVHCVGEQLHDGYGLTEAGPNIAINQVGRVRPGTVGRLLPGTLARIDGPRGEIQVSSPSLMSGYVDIMTGSVSRSALTDDGWLPTGDTGELSADGYLTVKGRIKEILIVQGETIAPSLIEDIIRTVPGVSEVAVLGRPDGVRGDVIHACVEQDGTQVDGGALRSAVLAACRVALPPVMRPRQVHILVRLPRTSSGKNDRAELARIIGAEK